LNRIPHRTAEWVPNIEPPIAMSLTGPVDPVAAPLLGEHTEQVLRDTLGYDERRISQFTQKGVFGSGKPSTSG
jgi:crotonobetainyl-CoA:carnitine CoA-transferase CaiB-like acyl-CoA transferase